jgi:phospholipid/cholesterol/gamma-HCH transport system substrate-binding protein
MANDQKGLEIKVGLFVLIGLVIIAVMAIQFGRVGQGLSDFYTVTVNFPNASGLVKNADVQLSGARIGVVADAPKAVPGQIGVIPVKLRIRSDIRLPKGSFFMIGKSGLMGDTSVMVALPTGFDIEKYDPNDESKLIPTKDAVLKGTPVTDFNDLASQGEKNMRKLGDTLDKIQNGVLSDESVANLQASFANIKTTSENIAQASTKIGPVITGAESAVNTAKETFTEAKAAMVTINGAATDVRGVVTDIRGMVKVGQGVLKQTQNGDGAIPMLLRDPQVANDLRSLIFNVRRHGVLFYRDSASQASPAPTATPVLRKKTR